MTNTRLALIVGANGGVGSEVGEALRRDGWQVRALVRQLPGEGRRCTAQDMQYIVGDAMCRDDVVRAAQGAAVIVHAVNPPGYRRWAELVVPMMDNSIAAAASSGARIVLPGTVYNYGPDSFPLIDESAPQQPLTRKGAIRVAMEQRLQEASRQGVRSLILRAGDFFGPRPGNNWFSQCLVKPSKRVKSILYPGATGIGHSWAYLPDFAETVAQLLARENDLAVFERLHFEGHWDIDGMQMIQAIRTALRQPGLPVRRFPWPLLTVIAPFQTFAREMREMRYLWREPLRLNNAKLLGLLPVEPRTMLEQAVSRTLAGLGVQLPEAALKSVAG